MIRLGICVGNIKDPHVEDADLRWGAEQRRADTVACAKAAWDVPFKCRWSRNLTPPALTEVSDTWKTNPSGWSGPLQR